MESFKDYLTSDGSEETKRLFLSFDDIARMRVSENIGKGNLEEALHQADTLEERRSEGVIESFVFGVNPVPDLNFANAVYDLAVSFYTDLGYSVEQVRDDKNNKGARLNKEGEELYFAVGFNPIKNVVMFGLIRLFGNEDIEKITLRGVRGV